MILRALFVDDEPENLRIIQHTLRPMQGKWDLKFAQSGDAALQLLAKQPFDVIITDIRMPEMDGTELLATVMQQYPKVIRFALYDHQDTDGINRASSVAHQYIPKLSTLEVIKSAIERAFSLRILLAGDRLIRVISRIRDLPGLPVVYQKINQELSTGDPSVKRIGQLIEQDPGLSAKMLKLVNSAFYGLRQQVGSPSHAATMLGLDTIRSLVLFVDLFEQFDRIRRLVPDFSLEEFQLHSVTVSNYAAAIARNQGLDGGDIDDAAMIGLLHDTGKLILAQNFPEQFNEALKQARAKKMSTWMAEWSIFGTTHAEVGAYLLGLWGLPDAIVEACAFHHQPESGPLTDVNYIAYLHVANAFAHEPKLERLSATPGQIDMEYLSIDDLDIRLPAWRGVCPPMQNAANKA